MITDGAPPSALQRWFSETGDIRNDPAVSAEILEFIKAHQAKSVVMTEGLLGCPHEEGIDYPDGEVCPHCPFWAHRKRFTGELGQ